jgi:BirA family biotin operon repressor/biotin-[acetyl-CoA-carboxylase] ligase
MGINVNVDLGSAPPLMAPATSLQMETGRPISRLDLLVRLLSAIEDRYEELKAGESFHSEWAGRMATLGHHVQVSSGPERWEGLATHVDEDGALWIRLRNGHTQRVLAADVTLRSPEHGA